MNFVLQFAWRDARASRRRLLLYSSTIVLGIAALVAVGSFGANVRRTLTDEPKRLLAGDVRIGLRAWPNAEVERVINAAGAEVARQKSFQSPISVRGEESAGRTVQVLALDGAFPLYGDLESKPAEALGRFRRGERVALVDDQVRDRYHLALGDSITLSSGTYAVAGWFDDVPGEPGRFLSFFGRVLVPWQTVVSEAGAGKPAEHGDFRLYLRLPPGAKEDAFASDLRERAGSAFPVIITSDQMGKNLDQALTQAGRFFSLVVFVALFLGAIGVASALHVYIQERLGRVAILRCLGCDIGRAMGVYLCQAGALGLCGSFAGALLGLAVQRLLPWFMRDLIPARIEIFFAPGAVFGGMATGFGICLVFCLLPLLAVRRVSPLAALRTETDADGGRDPARIAVWGLIAFSVAGFAYFETRSLPVTIGYTLALGIAFGFFAGTATAVAAIARRAVPGLAPFALRQGVANLYRPRNRTRLLLLALGLGSYVVLTVYLVHATLESDFAGASTPNLILSKVPDGEGPDVRSMVQAEKMRTLEETPTYKVKLVSVNGRAPTGRTAMRATGWEFDATSQASLKPYEKLVAGTMTDRVEPGAPVVPITVAFWTTGRRGIFKLGDEADWSVAGVPIHTRVDAIRRVQGVVLSQTATILFPLGALDGAPMETTFLLRSPNPAATARLTKSLTASHPKVSVFDLAMLVETVDRIFSKVTAVVDFIAFFTVATGLIILAAAVAAGRHQRARESALLRALGASGAQLRAIQLTEYAALGVLAGILGCGLAAAADAVFARYVLHIPVGGGGPDIAVAVAVIIAVTVATGVLAGRGLSNQAPLEILREEG